MVASNPRSPFSTSSSMSGRMPGATATPVPPDQAQSAKLRRGSNCPKGHRSEWLVGLSQSRMYELPVKCFTQTLAEGSSMDARSLISEVIRRSSVTCSDDTPLADIDGWDSLKGVRLIL